MRGFAVATAPLITTFEDNTPPTKIPAGTLAQTRVAAGICGKPNPSDVVLRLMDVVVYSRPGCHLCHEAIDLLAEHGLRAREVNIDEHPELKDRYNTCIPVVEIDGKERFRGRIDRVLLRRLLIR